MKTKSKGSYNGIEYFVNRCIELKNLNFLPKKTNTRFLLSEEDDDRAEEKIGKTDETLLNMVRQLKNSLTKIRTEKSQI